jgi:FixJ family two-component response regulator
VNSFSNATIFIIDDDPAIVEALRRLLSIEGYQVETFLSAEAFLESYDPGIPGCLIIDLTLPSLDGLQLQEKLIASGQDPAIIFLTGTGDITKSVQAMKSGALDFLTKPVEANDLFMAVHNAIEKDAERREKRNEISSLQERLITLSPREREVFEIVVKGRPNREIAIQLNVVEKTIKVHRGRITRKMGANSFAELVRMSERLGIGNKSN